MDTKLKPCPFCGSEKVHYVNNVRADRQVICKECFAYGPAEDTRSGAERAWNNRSSIDEH